MIKKILAILTFTYSFLNAQEEMKYDKNAENLPEWIRLMNVDIPDVGLVKDAYDKYYRINNFEKNKYTQYYKRWLRNISRYSNAKPNNKKTKSTHQWECIGPWDFDKDAESRSYAPGSAHIYTVEQSKSNPNILYAGSATAGAWKTTNKGDSWSLITKDLPLNSVYAIEIDFLNPDIIYISGNGGIYKSYDGGLSWNTIGDISFTNFNHFTKDIKLSPDNNNILFVASSEGLFKSTDGGSNFTQLMSGNFLEIEFHPNSSDTMYFVRQIANKTEFYRSDNGGNTLTLYSNGWPNPLTGDEQKRTEIAVSPADPNKIIALATGSANGGSGLYGIYISYDKGENWIFQCCGQQPAGVPDSTNINMMGWQPDGSDDGGQYYYDLALAVNPSNANIIHVGGVNHWISYDNGVSFTCPAKWSEPHKKGYVHADIHDINYFENDLWFACDGGIFYSDNIGDSIYKKQFGIAGTDFWGFGVGFRDGEVMLGGTYHNGTLLKERNTYINDWICTDGGDNIRGFVNFGDSKIAYSDYGGKLLSGNRNIPITNFNIEKLPNASYITGESSQIEFDPRCYNWFYSGKDTTLWLTKNGGSSFEAIYHFDDKITAIEVAWSNPEVIYLATWPSWWGVKKIWKSTNSGSSWVDITPSNINGQDWIPYDISVSSNDENILWAARTSMYGDTWDAQGYEVFKSIDGGQNWINLSTPTLDNINITNIEHQRGSDGGIYIGTRESVYYRNNSMSDWEIFNLNLPLNTYSTQLVPFYGKGLLRNGTNRSAYEVNFYEDSPPSAQIAANQLTIDCMNDTVKFIDHSALRTNSATWQWTFPGGTPSSSNLQNPVVVYSAPGKYDVTLTVTDTFGTSSQTYSEFIEYKDTVSEISNTTSINEDFENIIFPPESWNLNSLNYNWMTTTVDFGIDCQPTTTAFVNHYWVQFPSEETYLISNKIALGNGSLAQNWLTFDYAYSGYASGYDDGFRIDISANCGTSWDSIYGAFGSDLQTVAYESGSWSPTCGSWKSDSINLSDFGLNGDTLMFRFTAINDYGNNFYLDNINVNGQNILEISETHLFEQTSIYPNPNRGIFNISTNISELQVDIFSAIGKKITSKIINRNEEKIDLGNQASGVYFIKLTSNKNIELRKIIIK